jgi:hypothetical protein
MNYGARFRAAERYNALPNRPSDEDATVSWANGADFAPEFLIEMLIKEQQQAV